MPFDLNTARPLASASAKSGFDLNTAKPTQNTTPKTGGEPLRITVRPEGAATPTMPQDEQIFGPLRRDPTGQTYIDIPEFPEEMQNTIPAVGQMQAASTIAQGLLGGARNLATGLLTVGPDALGWDKQADTMRSFIPEIKQSGTLGEITQGVSQYALPAMGAVSKVAPIAQSLGKLGPLVSLAAASFADMLATDPGQASTIGDMVSPLAPTAIEPDDSNLMKRFKVGAETPGGELVAKLAKGGVSLAKGAGDIGAALKQRYTTSGKKELAQEAYRDSAANAAEAVRNIDETQAAVDALPNQGGGFKPLPGEASLDPNLIRLQRGLINEPALGNQKVANETNAAVELQGATTPTNVSREPLRQAAQAEADAITAPARRELETTQKNLNDVNAQMDAIKAEVNSAKGQKVTSSQQIAQTVRDVGAKLTSAKNELYNKIDPDGKSQVDGSDLIASIEAIEPRTWQSENVAPTSIQKSAAKAKENGGGVSFRDLMDLRAQLNEDMSTALKAGGTKQGGLYQNLSSIKESVDAKIAEIGNSTDPALSDVVENYKIAQDNYANIYAPVAKQGVSGKILRAAKGSQPVPDSVVGNEFLRRGNGATERVQSFNLVKEQADDAAGLDEAGYKWILDDFAQNALKGGEITPKSIRAWRELDGTKEILDQMPSVKAEIGRIQNLVDSGSGKKTQFMKDLERATGTLKQTEADVGRSAIGTLLKVSDEGIDQAVSGIIRGSNNVQNMRKLLTAAKKHSPEAVAALQDTVTRHLQDTLTQNSKTLGGEALKGSNAKLVDLLDKDVEGMKILEEVYGAGSPEIQAIKAVRTKMGIMARSGAVEGTMKSDTASNLANEAEVKNLLAAVVAQNFKQSRVLRMVGDMIPKSTEDIRKFLIVIASDPKLAKIALMKPTEKNMGAIRQGLEKWVELNKNVKTYTTNNIISTPGEVEDRRQDNEDNGKIPTTK